MNYALDALWWRLTDPDVRALASLLTAPPLWHTGCELPIRELLGEQGFRFLLELDEYPQALHNALAKEAPFHQRLGYYAESLLAFWFGHAPHSSLLARNIKWQGSKGGQGELDFAVVLNGQPYHIELTCKYYGAADADPEQMIGLNPHDKLADKVAKLKQQLGRLQDMDGQTVWQAAGFECDSIKSVSIVRGMGFTAANRTFEREPLNPYGWHGLYIDDAQELQFADIESNRRYYLLPRMDLLAPARVREEACLKVFPADALPGLWAVLEKRPDGYWHEIERWMKA